MSAQSVPLSIDLDPDLRERLKRLAHAKRRPSHWLMQEAVRRYVEREEKRDAFKQDAVAAWEEYRRSGLHLTGEEVAAWLETWGTDKEDAAPACRKSSFLPRPA